MRSRTSRPGPSYPTRLIQPAERPRRERAMARFDSAPPLLSSSLEACLKRPGRAGTRRTIVSPAVTTPGMLERGHVRAYAGPELVRELGVGAELRDGVPGQIPEVGGPALYSFAHHAVESLGEVQGAVEEVQGFPSLHGRVVSGEEVL